MNYYNTIQLFKDRDDASRNQERDVARTERQ